MNANRAIMALLGGFVLSLVLLSEWVGSAKTAQGPRQELAELLGWRVDVHK
jgi:hypothetical protein